MIFRTRKRTQDDFHREALPHLDALFYAARYMTKDAQAAEDLVQETFLKAFRFFHRYKTGTNCKAWLFRIMTNTHINRQRGKKKELSYIENADVESNHDVPLSETSAFYKNPEQGYLHGLVHDEVKSALNSLPSDFRAAVVLADLQDFSYKEIAEVMDCPIGTVMSRLHRGRKLLQKRLRSHAVEQGIIEDDRVTSLDAYRTRRSGP